MHIIDNMCINNEGNMQKPIELFGKIENIC
jgi:hypothetical protein